MAALIRRSRSFRAASFRSERPSEEASAPAGLEGGFLWPFFRFFFANGFLGGRGRKASTIREELELRPGLCEDPGAGSPYPADVDMGSRSLLRGVAGLLFPLAVAASVAILLARLAGEPLGWALVAPAVAVVLLGMLTAAALAAAAVVRRQWWWAAGLVALWPVTIPLYMRHRGRSRDRPGSEQPEV